MSGRLISFLKALERFSLNAAHSRAQRSSALGPQLRRIGGSRSGQLGLVGLQDANSH
jgi:hypothetical protein